MNISYRQLKAFIMLSKTRNFSRAAEQLFIAQSALSMMIRELESQLGFRLFDRTTRNVSLTKFGVELLEIAEKTIRSIDDVVDRVGKSAQDESLRLSVGAPPLSCAHLIPRVVGEFESRYPAVQLTIVDTDLANIAHLVEAGELDIGFGMFVKATPGLIRIPIFKFSVALATRADSFRVDPIPCRWSELTGLSFVALPGDNPFQQTIQGNLQAAGHRLHPKYTVNLIETQLAMAAAGTAVAIVPTTAILAGSGRGIAFKPIVDPVLEMDYFELRNRARLLPRCAEDFTDLIKNLIPPDVAPINAAPFLGGDA
jgi:DNA-binding transcriptional LysR family regulator